MASLALGQAASEAMPDLLVSQAGLPSPAAALHLVRELGSAL